MVPATTIRAKQVKEPVLIQPSILKVILIGTWYLKKQKQKIVTTIAQVALKKSKIK